MALTNKRILITAGPTWVPIDSVRVISNIATGETGILLADKFKQLGAEVTLLLGPVSVCCITKNIKLIRFKFFNELRHKINRELKTKQYDIVVHSAAVADYKLKKFYLHKVKSGMRNWKIRLVPTERIIDLIKKVSPPLFLVGFKFKTQATKDTLIKESKRLMQRAKSDLVVANSIYKNKYRAFIVDNTHVYGPMKNKQSLVGDLVRLISEKT